MVLHGGHVLIADPVLGGGAREALRCVLILLPGRVAPELAVNARQRHKQVRIVALHPGLLMQVGHVELAAWRMGQQLVVLLQDLMKAHVVEVDVLLQSQELITNPLSLCKQLLLVLLVVLLLYTPRQALQRCAQGPHQLGSELVYPLDLSLQLGEEPLLCTVCAVVVAGNCKGGGARGEGGLPCLGLMGASLDEVLQPLIINIIILPLLPALALQVLPVLHRCRSRAPMPASLSSQRGGGP
mmetsp:Transcript_687/g.1729  ORF Transcript_687/g.1729 Transcript_687/m.1729 type:complete len:241 (+) Transcript_687:2452-3174(+)